jgi:hypothetical protein
MNWSVSGLGQLDCVCEHGNGHFGSKKGGGFYFYYMRN